MMFSARSLGEASRSRRSAASRPGSAARRRVPLIGSARMPPSAAIRRNRSGEVLATVELPEPQVAGERRRVLRAAGPGRLRQGSSRPAGRQPRRRERWW